MRIALIGLVWLCLSRMAAAGQDGILHTATPFFPPAGLHEVRVLYGILLAVMNGLLIRRLWGFGWGGAFLFSSLFSLLALGVGALLTPPGGGFPPLQERAGLAVIGPFVVGNLTAAAGVAAGLLMLALLCHPQVIRVPWLALLRILPWLLMGGFALLVAVFAFSPVRSGSQSDMRMLPCLLVSGLLAAGALHMVTHRRAVPGLAVMIAANLVLYAIMLLPFILTGAYLHGQ